MVARLELACAMALGAALVVILSACSASPTVDQVDGPPGTVETVGTPDPASTPTVQPDPDPDSDVPWPAERPEVFEAEFGQDGGSAPWSEDLVVGSNGASYVVWMDGLEYNIDYTPAPERLDALYAAIADGRFDLYEAVPFEDGEVIYDAPGESWTVDIGSFRHRISINGNDIDSPNVGGSPLAAMQSFNDRANVPDATLPVTILLDESTGAIDLWGVELLLDLGDADLGVGDDRWTDRFEIFLTEPVVATALLARQGGTAGEVFFDGTLELDAGTTIIVSVGPNGAPGLSTKAAE